MTSLVQAYGPLVGVATLCTLLGLSRATFYRRQPPCAQSASAPCGAAADPGAQTSESGGRGASAPPALQQPGHDLAAARNSVDPAAPYALLVENNRGADFVGFAPTAPAALWDTSIPCAASLAAPPQHNDRGADSVGAAQATPRHPARALSLTERQQVLDLLRSPAFVDRSPAAIYAALLDEGRYLCSERTMYRLLDAHGELRERRDQLRHPSYAAPQLLATAPNQLWSWDITKLRGPGKWEYFHLYVILDVFSRYVVGWMVADREADHLAEQLIDETCQRQGIPRGQLTLHADRGASMTSRTVAILLAELGVTKSHSRPYVSDDNPFSEAHFKTLKYRPDFPDRFGCLEDAIAHCRVFFPWYNTEHYHSGIAMLTPHDLHYGLAPSRIAHRTSVLAAAYAAHPERFVHGAPRPQQPPHAVWINKPKQEVPSSQPPQA